METTTDHNKEDEERFYKLVGKYVAMALATENHGSEGQQYLDPYYEKLRTFCLEHEGYENRVPPKIECIEGEQLPPTIKSCCVM